LKNYVWYNEALIINRREVEEMGGERYTREEQIAKFEKVKDIRFFYKKKFLNNSGKTKDTNEFYSEIAAEWIIEHIDGFKQITPIHRNASYYTEGHDGKYRPESTSEKNIAKRIFQQGKQEGIPGIGIILDYETPLNDELENSAGKIDLLAFDQKNNVLRILELKRPDNDESMLRCVLEAYSYSKLVDREKLIRNFNVDGNFSIPEGTPIVACPLVFRYNSNGEDGAQYNEMQEDRPKLRELMKLLEIKPLVIEENKPPYSAYELEL
jgi:hypothetical protein